MSETSETKEKDYQTDSTELSDDNELRGAEFNKLIRKPSVLLVIFILAAIGFFIGLSTSILTALIISTIVVAINLGIVFYISDRKAENAFFESYAINNNLLPYSRSLPESTKLLRSGDKRKTEHYMSGNLGGRDIILALFTYTTVSTDSNGGRNETDYPFTVVHVAVPESVESIRELRVQRKSGLKMLEGVEDVFRRKSERVTLESEAMRDKYEIFVNKEHNPVSVRRVFSPTFIVWLTEEAPKKFFFELENGNLCCAVPRHRKNTKELDEMLEVGLSVSGRVAEGTSNGVKY